MAQAHTESIHHDQFSSVQCRPARAVQSPCCVYPCSSALGRLCHSMCDKAALFSHLVCSVHNPLCPQGMYCRMWPQPLTHVHPSLHMHAADVHAPYLTVHALTGSFLTVSSAMRAITSRQITRLLLMPCLNDAPPPPQTDTPAWLEVIFSHTTLKPPGPFLPGLPLGYPPAGMAAVTVLSALSSIMSP